VNGIRAAADFTRVPWVKRQFLAKLAIEVYPGTLNLEIADEDLEAFETLKAGAGIDIAPEQSTYCSAKCFPVLIAGQVKGAVVFPLVPDYPANKMELVAPVQLRETLSLNAGDLVEVEVLESL
jgi:riboflavin kinase